jgi:hypothetical protein
VLLAVCDSLVDQLRVLLLLGRGEDEGGVGGGILGLVLLDGRKVTRVGDDSLQSRMSAAVQSFFGDAGCWRVASPSAPPVIVAIVGWWGLLTVPVAFN